MSFWRKLNKVIFYICMVFACLGVVGGAMWGFGLRYQSWMGWVILLGGAVSIPVLFSAWGILLEFLDNVADIRRAVCNGQRILSNHALQQGQIDNTASQAESQYAQPVFVPENWECTGCGTKNDGDSNFCFKCGKPRE